MKIGTFTVALLVALWLIIPAFAQEPKSMAQGPGMRMHDDMQAEMKAMDEKLDKLVIDMNTAATPDKKLDSAIAVINEIVAQHKKMNQHRMQRWEGHHRHELGDSPKSDRKS